MNVKQGFTILELSISLIVVTLLVATITNGISIIENAENRKIIADYNNYKTAINNFKLQYNQLPGDFYNAYMNWPTQCGNTDCNGNGNGIIEYVGSNLTNDESLHAWQHLVLSGFISGNYNGARTSTSLNTIGTNVPDSVFIGSGWAFYNTQAYSTNNINSLIFGAAKASSLNDAATITTKSASYIDSKIDDGSARTGNILGLYSDDALGNYGTGAISTVACVQNTSATGTIATKIINNGYYYVNKDDGNARCALQFIF